MDVVTYGKDGTLGFCTLNRPEKLNALSHEVVERLQQVLAEAAADDEVKVFLLTGAGRSFSAGYDLAEEAGERIEGARAGMRILAADVSVTMALFSFPKPTIAVVRGWCLAGGCELAMACDIVIAADDAKFGEPRNPLRVRPCDPPHAIRDRPEEDERAVVHGGHDRCGRGQATWARQPGHARGRARPSRPSHR